MEKIITPEEFLSFEKKLFELKLIYVRKDHPESYSFNCHHSKDWQDILEKNAPEIYEYSLRFDSNLEFIYAIKNRINYRPKCPYCGEEVSFPKDLDLLRKNSGTFNYARTCGKGSCVAKEVENALYLKYGVKTTMDIPGVKEKIKRTCLNHYGVDWASKAPEVQRKVEGTFLKKYGTRRASQSQEVKNTARKNNLKKWGYVCTLQDPEVREKARQTCIERYGTPSPAKLEAIKKKVENTCREKFGTKSPTQNPEVLRKVKDTCKKHWGVEFPIQNSEIKEKTFTTNRNNHGGILYIQTPKAREKSSITCKKTQPFKHGRYKYDNLPFDSSYEIAVYNHYKKLGIPLIRNPQSGLYYINNKGEKNEYHPDFLNPETNKFIEAKCKRFIYSKSYEELIFNNENIEVIWDGDGSIFPYLEEARSDFGGGSRWYVQFRNKKE